MFDKVRGMNFIKIAGIISAVIAILLLLSLAELWTQIFRYQNYWSRQNKTSEGAILYVALGDSTAQGIGAARADKGYVGIVAKGISEKRDQSVRTVNLSKSGAKVKDVLSTQLSALEDLEINNQTIITIEIGANDIMSFDPLEFEIQVDELMERLPEQTLISDIPYFGGSRYRAKQSEVERANEIMYKMAQKHNRQLVPLHDKIKNNDGIKNYAIDYFHPSGYSYRENWAPVFLNRL